MKYLKTGSAFYAPSASAVAMVEAMLLDSGRILPCCALLKGEYGVKNMYAGVPVVIGKKGVEKVIKLKLSITEKKQFNKSVKAVRSLTNLASKLITKK